MSYLTQSYDKLKADLIAALEGEGFSYNPNATSFTEYLSVALGNSSAHLRKSLGKLLSDLDAQYGGSLSELRASIAHLMDDAIANIGAGGGGGLPSPPAGFAYILNKDNAYIVNKDGAYILAKV